MFGQKKKEAKFVDVDELTKEKSAKTSGFHKDLPGEYTKKSGGFRKAFPGVGYGGGRK